MKYVSLIQKKESLSSPQGRGEDSTFIIIIINNFVIQAALDIFQNIMSSEESSENESHPESILHESTSFRVCIYNLKDNYSLGEV